MGFGLAMYLLLPVAAWGRSFRVAQLPNGNVSSCANCHVNPGGGGPRNVFGVAVGAITGSANVAFWSPVLAQVDSDGDGFSNGTELGDPDGDFKNLGPSSRVSLPGNALSTPPLVNTAPSITPVADREADEGVPLSFTVEATDPDAGQVLSYSFLSGAPEGATLNPTTGVIRWTPSEAQGPSVATLSVVVADNGSPVLRATNSFTVTVREVNAAPSWTPVADQTVRVGETLTFTALATDLDLPAQGLVFSLGADAPAGAAVVPATGVFSWTPAAGQGPSTNLIQLVVTDQGEVPLSATNAVRVVVTASKPVESVVTDPTLTAGGFACSVVTEAGLTYFLDFQSTLGSTTWTQVAQVAGDGNAKVLQDPNPLGPQGYYRVRVE